MDALEREMVPSARLKAAVDAVEEFVKDQIKKADEPSDKVHIQKLRDKQKKPLADLLTYLGKTHPFGFGDAQTNGSTASKVWRVLKQVHLAGGGDDAYTEAKAAWLDWYEKSEMQKRVEVTDARMAINGYLHHVSKDVLRETSWLQAMAQVSAVREALPSEPKDSEVGSLGFVPNPIPAMKKRLKLLADLVKGYGKVIKVLTDVISSVPKAIAELRDLNEVKKIEPTMSVEEKEKAWDTFVTKMKANAKKAVAAMGRISGEGYAPDGSLNPGAPEVITNAIRGKPLDSPVTKNTGSRYAESIVLAHGLGDALKAKYPKWVNANPNFEKWYSPEVIEEYHQMWLKDPKWTKL